MESWDILQANPNGQANRPDKGFWTWIASQSSKGHSDCQAFWEIVDGNGEKEKGCFRQLLLPRRMDTLSLFNLLRHMKVRDDSVDQAEEKSSS